MFWFIGEILHNPLLGVSTEWLHKNFMFIKKKKFNDEFSSYLNTSIYFSGVSAGNLLRLSAFLMAWSWSNLEFHGLALDGNINSDAYSHDTHSNLETNYNHSPRSLCFSTLYTLPYIVVGIVIIAII